MTDKKQLFVSALMKTYGDNTQDYIIVNRSEIIAVKNKSIHPSHVCITKNPDHKVGRNQYVIVEDMTKTIEYRDNIIAGNIKKEKAKLPTTIRNDALALAKVIKAAPDAPAKKEKKSSTIDILPPEDDDSLLSLDDIYDAFDEQQEINDIMNSMGYKNY